MLRYCPIFLFTLLAVAACRGEEEAAPTAGDITASISCSAQDSLVATLYMAGGDRAAASAWCNCGAGSCNVQFVGLGFGDYILGVGEPDSLYRASEGAEGFVRPIAYFGADTLAADPESATAITLSDSQPRADVELDLTGDGM